MSSQSQLAQQGQRVRVYQGHRLHGRMNGLAHRCGKLSVDGAVRQHNIALSV
jgi:hypothetical protein